VSARVTLTRTLDDEHKRRRVVADGKVVGYWSAYDGPGGGKVYVGRWSDGTKFAVHSTARDLRADFERALTTGETEWYRVAADGTMVER
jgi:hypothetical protein